MFSPIFFSRYVRIGILFIVCPPFIIQLPYYKYLRPFKQFLLCIFLNFIRHVYMGVAAKNEDLKSAKRKSFFAAACSAVLLESTRSFSRAFCGVLLPPANA